jgi:SAM-dependent methyltransferase
LSDNKEVKWFEEWFNSRYYHILYKHRNCNEAELFIDNLLGFLQPKEDAAFLDLACGKGRHSVYLNKKGFNITGIDLADESIAAASIFENKHLSFFVHDMRRVFRINYFDYVLNLFTSFGYFENQKDDYATINTVFKALKPNGVFVFDFLNTKKTIAKLVETETKTIDNIEFKISRHVADDFIVKQILVNDKGKEFSFQERVKALTLKDFEKYFAANKLKIVHLFGNYQLEKYNEYDSDRLIIIAKKEEEKL